MKINYWLVKDSGHNRSGPKKIGDNFMDIFILFGIIILLFYYFIILLFYYFILIWNYAHFHKDIKNDTYHAPKLNS